MAVAFSQSKGELELWSSQLTVCAPTAKVPCHKVDRHEDYKVDRHEDYKVDRHEDYKVDRHEDYKVDRHEDYKVDRHEDYTRAILALWTYISENF